NFKSVIFIGIAIGFVGMLCGIFLSYYWETPASATITMIFISIFLVVNLLALIRKKL
ncbi:metal ABC transporter permease, partial [Streptococcus pyogenes]